LTTPVWPVFDQFVVAGLFQSTTNSAPCGTVDVTRTVPATGFAITRE
jgi:hypothetical protein